MAKAKPGSHDRTSAERLPFGRKQESDASSANSAGLESSTDQDRKPDELIAEAPGTPAGPRTELSTTSLPPERGKQDERVTEVTEVGSLAVPDLPKPPSGAPIVHGTPEAAPDTDKDAIRKADEGGEVLDADMEDDQELYIPVHGFVRLTDDEVAILNHPALQRLGLIYQLGQAHLVFRGATHKRIEHSIGTLGAAALIIQALDRNDHRKQALHCKSGAAKTDFLSNRLSRCERAFIRLASLAHDIGHLPVGHTLEDELGLLDTHDYMPRINHVLDRTSWPGAAATPTLRALINHRYSHYLPKDSPFAAAELFAQIIAKDVEARTDFEQKAASVTPPIRVAVCRDIVGNTICADLLDYLHRDLHHVGKPKHFDQRLPQYFELTTDPQSNTDAFVVSLGRRPKIRNDAISAILDLLESRYQLSETVLFHRTKLAFAAMLGRGLQELQHARGDQWSRQLVERLLDLTDEGMLDFFLAEATGSQGVVSAALMPLRALRARRVYTHLFTRFSEEYPADVVTRLKFLYARRSSRDNRESDDVTTKMSATRAAAKARLEALQLLEKDFSLPDGSLAMYCPSSMNDKIAKVKIAIDDQVAPFDSWEDQPNRLSGGHLAAQRNRFNRLWRVHVFIERSLAAQLEATEPQKLLLLKSAIKELVFPKTSDPAKLCHRGEMLALQASKLKELPNFFGHEIRAAGTVIAARAQAPGSAASGGYPSGAPTLLSFVS
jgi:HD superfamily phosphohydrolase